MSRQVGVSLSQLVPQSVPDCSWSLSFGPPEG